MNQGIDFGLLGEVGGKFKEGKKIRDIKDGLLKQGVESCHASKIIRSALRVIATLELGTGRKPEEIKKTFLRQGLHESTATQIMGEALDCHVQVRNGSGADVPELIQFVQCAAHSGLPPVGAGASERANREAGITKLVIGGGMLALGGAITLVSYRSAAPEGTYVVTIGLFLCGAAVALRGLIGMATGRET